MQSYEHHIVRETLEMRHPYLQDDAFTPEIEPTQISVAVFDRYIAKFKEVLLVEDLEFDLVRDALKTLNELVHHQETSDQMIEQGILEIVSSLLKSQDAEVREQSALLLGSFASSAIARQLFDYAFGNMRDLLEDETLAVREACAWTFERLSGNDDGNQRIVQSGSPEDMAKSFVMHSSEDQIKKRDAQYLIHLLEAMINLTFSDSGIESLSNFGLMEQIAKIFDGGKIEEELEEHYSKIAQLCLRVVGNFSINSTGKQECIENQISRRAYKFLIDGPGRTYEDALNTSLILMSVSIHLEGKQNIVNLMDEQGVSIIIAAMIKRLEDNPDLPDLRKNLIVALTNIAELPDGFQTITWQLVTKIDILDEVFGPSAVKPLHNFLPKLSELEEDEQLLQVDSTEAAESCQVIQALAHLFKKYKEVAAQVAINETVNFAEKLAPFMDPQYGVQKEVFTCLMEILTEDSYNCHILQKFLLKYQEMPVKREPDVICTLRHELREQCREIYDLAMGPTANILT